MDWRLMITSVIPLPMTSRFVNHNGRHWIVKWWHWRGRAFAKSGHRLACCASGTHEEGR